jgi:arabinofuranosyltransferase
MVVLAVVIVNNAWVGDAAYYTLRTIDHFVTGDGLRWNVSERVQAYTHPLWLALLVPAYAITRESFHTTLTISFACVAGTVALLSGRIAGSATGLILALLTLAFSKAFVDFSTSGLETPLTYFLLAWFFASFWQDQAPASSCANATAAERGGAPPPIPSMPLAKGTAYASLIVLSSAEAALLVLPVLATALHPRHGSALCRSALLGLVPIAAWLTFSTVYYGFPLPNPFYAWWHSGISLAESSEQGFYYLLNSIRLDPLTLTIVVTAVALAMGDHGARPIAAGLVLCLAVVVVTGGDSMSGRRLAAPLLVATMYLSRRRWPGGGRLAAVPSLIVVVAGLAAPHPTIWGEGSRAGTKDLADVVDVRRFSYRQTALMSRARPARRPGTRASATPHPLEREMVFAISAYEAGRSGHVIDWSGRADTLLARRPVQQPWRIDQPLRVAPAGYECAVRSGNPRLLDPEMAGEWERLALATRGPILSRARLLELLALNGLPATSASSAR